MVKCTPILLAHITLSSSGYLMITYTYPLAHTFPIKTLVARRLPTIWHNILHGNIIAMGYKSQNQLWLPNYSCIHLASYMLGYKVFECTQLDGMIA